MNTPSKLDQASGDAELLTINYLIERLATHDADAIARILTYVGLRFGVAAATSRSPKHGGGDAAGATTDVADPRLFLEAKSPQSDVERAAVLAYWLRLQGTTQFASSDIDAANRDAAGRKFDVVQAGKDAIKRGVFAAAGQRRRQLTIFGERLVEALPDRGAVTLLNKQQQSSRRRPQRPKREVAREDG